MKNQMLWALLGLILLSTPSCLYFDDDGPFPCTSGEGPLESFEFDLEPITGIEITNSVDVYLSQGSEQSVIVEGQENIIDRLDLDVNNGIWKIHFEGCVRNLDQVKIFITLPQVDFLEISGSGDIVGQTFLTGEDLYIRINGSGDMDLGLEYEDIDVKISASGDLAMEGTCEDLELTISGSGDVSAFDLETQDAEIQVNGSGDSKVFVSEILDVTINGSGDVYYRGFPVISADINGSGDLIDAN